MNNRQLVHIFAQENKTSGKASNIFFEWNTLYSYGYHFILSKIVQTENRAIYTGVAFVNTNSYSKTTAKHRSYLNGAFPNYMPVYYVPFPSNRSLEIESDLPKIRESLISQINDLLEKQLRAKLHYNHFEYAQRILSQINDLSRVFPSSCEPLESSFFPRWNEAQTKALEAKKKLIEANKRKKELQALKEGEKLNLWLSGQFNGSLYNLPIHLRFSKDRANIETTRGAKVPTEEAFKLLNDLRSGKDCKGVKIGSFTVEESTLDHVKIGCHVIQWEVINQFFKD